MAAYLLQTLDGSAAAPAHSFASDTDCGLYRIGANNLGLAVAGAKVVDIAAAGVAVTGTLSSSGAATLNSAVVTNNATVGGTFGVTGNTTLSGTLGVTGNLAVATNKFTVTASNGNTAVAGTFGVTGAATLSSTLAVTGNTTLSGLVGIGAAPATYIGVRVVNPPLTSASSGYQIGIDIDVQGTTAGTTQVTGLNVRGGSAASAYTVGEVIGLQISNAQKGAGSTITTVFGLYVADQTTGTDNYAIYTAGTAKSRFGGNVNVVGVLQSNGTQVVSTRKTGWTAATGTATRSTFDTATVTTAQLAERVKALIDDLHATAGHGLIGA